MSKNQYEHILWPVTWVCVFLNWDTFDIYIHVYLCINLMHKPIGMLFEYTRCLVYLKSICIIKWWINKYIYIYIHIYIYMFMFRFISIYIYKHKFRVIETCELRFPEIASLLTIDVGEIDVLETFGFALIWWVVRLATGCSVGSVVLYTTHYRPHWYVDPFNNPLILECFLIVQISHVISREAPLYMDPFIY